MSPGITVNIVSARGAVMCVVSTTNTFFFFSLFVWFLFFFPNPVAVLLLSPCFFVASPPFLLLSASKRCYPVVSFAYRTFDVWPHRRRQRCVVVFLRRRYRPLLSFFSCSFFRVVRGAGGAAVIWLLPSQVLSPALSGWLSRRCLCRRYRALRSRWRPPAAATAPRNVCQGRT